MTDISDSGAIALAKNNTLKELSLSNNKIGLSSVQALADNSSLETLDLSGKTFGERPPRIGDEGAKLLSNNKTMKKLTLCSQNITAKGVSDLVKNTQLRTLNLGINKIGDEGAAIIAESSITDLYCYHCNITDKGAKALASKRFNILYLVRNYISDAGAYAFAKQHNVTSLDLMLNEIHDEGAIALSMYGTMKSLNVYDNRIGKIGHAALQNNSFIKELIYGGKNPHPPNDTTSGASGR